jgi:putative nucleotidyltransferase with HDIG domain
LVNSRLEDYLAEASDDLPTVPDVADRVIEVLDDPDSSADDVRAVIQRDASLAARILKVSNSAMYGIPSEISSVGQAISLIGARAVRNLVMAVAMREVYREFGELEQRLWDHGSAAGPVAAAIARHFKIEVDVDGVFTAGLLHDIGKTALANSHRAEYEALSKEVGEGGAAGAAAEREQFGFDHAELGARVAESWKLPPPLIEAIRHHHDEAAFGTLGAAEGRLAAVVSLASHCLARLGIGRPAPCEELDLPTLPAWSFLGLPDAEATALLELCAEQVEAAKMIGG